LAKTKVLAELRSKTEISSSAKTQLKSTGLSRLVYTKDNLTHCV